MKIGDFVRSAPLRSPQHQAVLIKGPNITLHYPINNGNGIGLNVLDMVPAALTGAEPEFHKGKHVKYWLRCLKTLLPSAYASQDSQRMTLACFTLSALDLLDALHGNTSFEERQSYVQWIYRCQHPHGGFKGFTGASGGDASTYEGNSWDPANLAATFFALSALMILDDDLLRVRKFDCLRWVRRLQRVDGGFGEALGKNDAIEGGGDMRHCYLAAAVRWILRRGEHQDGPDISCDNMTNYIEQSVVSAASQ